MGLPQDLRTKSNGRTIFHVDILGGPINLVCQAKRKSSCTIVTKNNHDFHLFSLSGDVSICSTVDELTCERLNARNTPYH